MDIVVMRAWVCQWCSESFKYRNDAEAHEQDKRCVPAFIDTPRWPRS